MVLGYCKDTSQVLADTTVKKKKECILLFIHFNNYLSINHYNWNDSKGHCHTFSQSVYVREGNGTPLQYLAWKISWMEEPCGLQSMGSLRVGHDWTTSLSLFTFMHWRRKWQPTPVFLPAESQGRGAWWLLSMGSHKVGHDWSDLAVAAVSVVEGSCCPTH